MTYEIKQITDGKIKSNFTRMVLEKLTVWFGIEKARTEYVESVQHYPFWAAVNSNDECIGFFSAKTHYATTGEIYVCGVMPDQHNMGVGKELYKNVEAYFQKKNCQYAIVKTLSSEAEYEPYEKTRKFYKKIGFSELITLSELWDEENPCLIMIKKI